MAWGRHTMSPRFSASSWNAVASAEPALQKGVRGSSGIFQAPTPAARSSPNRTKWSTSVHFWRSGRCFGGRSTLRLRPHPEQDTGSRSADRVGSKAWPHVGRKVTADRVGQVPTVGNSISSNPHRWPFSALELGPVYSGMWAPWVCVPSSGVRVPRR